MKKYIQPQAFAINIEDAVLAGSTFDKENTQTQNGGSLGIKHGSFDFELEEDEEY